MKKVKLAFIALLIILLGCSKEKENEISYCQSELKNEISGFVIGNYDDSHHHVLTIGLKNEICIITRNSIRIFPYDTINPKYQIDGNFKGAVVNEFDTIIQMDNSFYRFYPTSRELEPIYTPQFSIHDFCVTPNHGIGYMWGNVFVEPPKFNYYTFGTSENKTHFEYAKFIPDSPNPYRQYQTYLKDDSLRLFLSTDVDPSNAHKSATYRINLQDTVIKNRLYFTKGSLHVLDFQDFEIIDIKYGNAHNQALIATHNLISGATDLHYSFTVNWMKSSHFVEGDNLSITYKHLSGSDKTLFVNWRTGVKYFSVVTPEEYFSTRAQIQHYDDKLVLLYNQDRNTAIGFDKYGCKQFEIIGEDNINSIVYMDDEKIVTLTDQNLVELFRIE